MQIPIVQSIYDKSRPTMYAQPKMEPASVENIRTGKGNFNLLNLFSKIKSETEQGYGRDEIGQIKLKLVTGQLIDLRA